MKLFKQASLSLILGSVLYTAPQALSVMGFEQGQAHAGEERKTKKVPALRERVYSQLARAQKLADEKQPQEGLAVLSDIAKRADSMNSYERAMLWNFTAFIHYNLEQYPEAISYFEKVVAEDAIPESLQLSTLKSIAQLHMMQENYEQTIAYLDRWKAANTKALTANDYVLFAQVYYQTKQYQNAVGPISTAISLVENKGEAPKENWLILQRAVYFELKQPEKVAAVLEKMVRLFDKPEYWIQLGGMYGELEKEKEQLAVLEAAWQAGYITKSSDILNLAQLYYFHQVPFKAGRLLEQAMEKGIVEKSVKNLEFLAQAWSFAKEEQKSIPALVQAAELSDSGNLDARLGEVYLNLEQWKKAVDASLTALKKGELKNEGQAHLVLGMAYFNLNKFDKSIASLGLATGFKKSQKMASQWAKYVSNEKESQRRLALLTQNED